MQNNLPITILLQIQILQSTTRQNMYKKNNLKFNIILLRRRKLNYRRNYMNWRMNKNVMTTTTTTATRRTTTTKVTKKEEVLQQVLEREKGKEENSCARIINPPTQTLLLPCIYTLFNLIYLLGI